MKSLFVAAIALQLLSGCATTGPEAETPKALAPIEAKWVQAREAYYRNLGWTSLDAHDQAEHDLEFGKTPPVDRAHMARGRTLN